MDMLGELAAFAAETRDVPDAVLEKTALILADTLGAVLGGMAEAEVSALAGRLATGGPVPVMGTALSAAPGVAAFLHGTAGTTLEMDEGNQFARGHPGVHTIPAALAVVSREVDGRELLTAITLGYEVGARIGAAARLRPQMHPHGTWGTICAAVAVARLAGADAAAMRTAINMGAGYGLTTSKATMLEGGTVRNTYAGVSGQMGVLIGDLLAAGYSADRDAVSAIWGHVASDGFDTAAATDALGDRWEVARNYFKMHACCRYNHAALDALATLDVAPGDVARIEVETYSLAAELDDPAPVNVLGAKFSVPFAVATKLVHGSSDVLSFTQAAVENAEVRALAAKVTVREDPAMTAQLPDRRPARVTVHLADGRVLTAATETNRGDWADPYSAAEIERKYLSLCARLWSAEDAERLWNAAVRAGDAPAGRLLDAMARKG